MPPPRWTVTARTLELCERRFAAYPSDVNQHGLALTQARVGDALAERGDMPGAMESYRQSLAIREALGRNHPVEFEISQRVDGRLQLDGEFFGRLGQHQPG